MNAPGSASLVRSDHRIPPADSGGMRLYVRHVQPAARSLGTVVLIHGATLASGLWDIGVPGYSTLEVLAQAGFSAWAPDLRGYGRSDRLTHPVSAYAGLEDARSDIQATVEHARAEDGVEQVLLVGGSWGSITTASYASSESRRVRALALMAPIYATPNALWLAELSDPDRPGLFRASLGPTRSVQRDDLLRRWDPEIPYPDKSRRREEAVLDALVGDALDAEMMHRGGQAMTDQAFTVPNGALHDLFEAFSGRPLYEPRRLCMPVLLVRGEHDATSTATDVERLCSRLGASSIQRHDVPDAGHFVCAERAATGFQACLIGFLHRHAG